MASKRERIYLNDDFCFNNVTVYTSFAELLFWPPMKAIGSERKLIWFPCTENDDDCELWNVNKVICKQMRVLAKIDNVFKTGGSMSGGLV